MKGAAGVANKLLHRAEIHSKHLLEGPAAAEALHDFRVSLRRLLVHLKNYGLAKGKARKRLKHLYQSTGPLRDAQIEKAWLASRGRRWGARKGNPGPLSEQAERLCRAYSLDPNLSLKFKKESKRLRRDLRAESGWAFNREHWELAAAKSLRRRSRKLIQRLGTLEKEYSPKALHLARIALKTLRYLAEPVGRGTETELLRPLKRLQALLGDIHDRELIENDLNVLRVQEPSVSVLAAKAVVEIRKEKAQRLAKARKAWRIWLKEARNLN